MTPGRRRASVTLAMQIRHAVTVTLSSLFVLAVTAAPAAAQTSPPAPAGPTDAAKAVLGAWELSTADRERTCNVTFRQAAAGPGLALDWDKACVAAFPLTREITAWMVGQNDAIRLLDAKGRILLELTEVESGLYEGLRPGEPLYFLQGLAAVQGERTAEQVAGDWAFVRAGKPICQLSLTGEPAGPERLTARLKPGCDAAITGFAPRAWQFDRGQIVILPARGDGWRFEEDEKDTWKRVPESRQAITLVKQ